MGYDYFYVTLILLDGFPKYKFKALCVVFLSEPVAILKLTVGSIMDLVTHDGFPTSTTGRANKEIQLLNLFSAGRSGN